MTPRSIRRAAERKAAKLARKAARASGSPDPIVEPDTFDEPEAFAEPEPNPTPVSKAQLAANRRNSLLSTGPTSSAGKAKVSLNAVKSGLTGRTVVLTTEDAAAYEQYVQSYQQELAPVGQLECDLVQSVADCGWRLQRIPGLEMAIYAKGRIDFADFCNEYDESLRPAMIELEISLAYQKDLRNLQVQEARLHRRREKDLAELRKLQQERATREAAEAEKVQPKPSVDSQTLSQPHAAFDFSENGFEFSTGTLDILEQRLGIPSDDMELPDAA